MVIRQFAALFAIRRRLKIKVKFDQLFCEYCYSHFIRTINSLMWTFTRHSQKCYQYDLSIPVMEGFVFVYIFRAISFAGHLNDYSQFAFLLQLICCFLFANVNESKGSFLRSRTWFVYIQFLIIINSPWTPWSKVPPVINSVSCLVCLWTNWFGVSGEFRKVYT